METEWDYFGRMGRNEKQEVDQAWIRKEKKEKILKDREEGEKVTG